MKALLVARKTLVEIARELQLLGLVLALPLAFVGLAAATYTGSLLVTYPILVVGSPDRSQALVDDLRALHYADGRPILNVTLTGDRETADAALKDQSATALLVVAADGSGATIVGDALYARFYRASTILNSVVNRYADQTGGRPELVHIVEQPLAAAGPLTEFDLYAPGMMVFAWLMIIPQTAMLVAREIRWGTLRRLRLTRLTAGSLLGGISLAQMAVAVIQVLVVFGASVALGFHNRGSLALALVVGLAVSFSAVGQGLLVSCFVENDSQAANVGSSVAMLQVFLSGAFYQMPPLTLFDLAGHQIDLFDLFPASHGFLALQQILSYGAGLREIGFRLGATLALSSLYFVLGVAVFRRLQMRQP